MILCILTQKQPRWVPALISFASSLLLLPHTCRSLGARELNGNAVAHEWVRAEEGV